ncbi:WD40 repeat domain-containing serine/threonine protein kinase [Actinocorallia longicatena]|uniref:non-specific serine/threonine protein kinase n=1 Tax=Actinocorallia longicatena TaxID=111803 RepID=A0ABP6QFH9_9ACTN
MADSEGTLISGRYRLVAVIGSGGMGRVWRGHDELIGREVAVKEVLLPPDLGPEQRANLAQRAMREARSAGRLNHPGIVTVHAVVEYRGAPAIVMEYVPGGSLADAIRAEGRLPAERVTGIAAAMLGALRVAHEAGIVHRDLKPANVLLAGDRVVITDFGIASLTGDAQITRSGVIIGTPAFMSPEQAHRERATPASDLWSLGATLYAAVEGRPPFDGEDLVAVLSALLTREPPPPLHAGPLAPLLEVLLSKDPARRPTAAQASELLSAPASAPRWPTPVPVREPGPHPTVPATGRVGRRALLLGGAGLAAVAIGVPVAVQLFGSDGTPRRKPGGGTSGSVPPAVEDLPAQESGPATPTEITEERRITGHEHPIVSVAFSPDGRLLASCDNDLSDGGAKTRLWNAATGAAVVTLAGPPGVGGASADAVAFSPDGVHLVSGGSYLGDSTRVWRLSDRKLLGALDESRSIMKSLAYSPDGRFIAGVTHTGVFTIWTAATRKVRIGLPGNQGFRNVVFSPDGRHLASGGGGSDVKIYDVATWKTVHTIGDVTGDGISFSPDSRTLAIPDSDGTRGLRLFDVASGKETAAFPRLEEDLVASVLHTPDGRSLLTIGHGRAVHLWDIASQRVRATLVGHSGRVTTMAVTPDGTRLATGDQDKTILLWKLP